MGRINTGRVILGGLLAGLIINVGEIIGQQVFAAEAEAMMERFGMEPPGGLTIGIFVVIGFIMGIAITWLYAAVRPRLGAGPKTAVIAGLVVWFIGYFLPLLGDHLVGVWSAWMMIVGSAWGLVEFTIAALAGGWLYREVEST